MKNLDNIVDKIEKNIDKKEEVREKALELSRDIITNCRKAIQKIHQDENGKAEELIKKGKTKLKKLYKKTDEFADIQNSGFVENATQELVEAHSLNNIMKEKELPEPDELGINYSSYLLGLCDLIGELRRASLDSIRKGKCDRADKYLDMMEDIYEAIIRFDYPSGLIPVKRKQDIARKLIEKTRGELAVVSCEKRIENKIDDFREVLDKIGKRNKEKRKKEKDEGEINGLNIDEIWE